MLKCWKLFQKYDQKQYIHATEHHTHDIIQKIQRFNKSYSNHNMERGVI